MVPPVRFDTNSSLRDLRDLAMIDELNSLGELLAELIELVDKFVLGGLLERTPSGFALPGRAQDINRHSVARPNFGLDLLGLIN